ncbi:MAG: calcium/proton exchanger [Chloroflexota bacterium]|nr:calcium/proton exchanger [Chloroflexota bacterium]
MAQRTGITFSGEQRVMGVFLLFVPATLLSAYFGLPSSLQFFLSVGAVIPLAAYIGAATEALADRLGGKIGGLLNATFGNAPDLLVGVFGVQRGLIPLVKATLIGALISNSALIMGLCYIAAGLVYRNPRFKVKEAGHHSVLMMLTVGAVLFPSIGAIALGCGTTCHNAASSRIIQGVSVSIAVVLLLAYVAYIVFGIFGVESLKFRMRDGEDSRRLIELAREEGSATWPPLFGLAVLVLTTIALIPITDILTGSVVPVTQMLGWSQVFVGMVIVANAGNVAEGYAALKFAIQRGGVDPETGDSGLDLAIGIASASSIQIATFVAPLVVLYSLTTHTMSLVFSSVEIAILAVLVAIFTFIAQDGESNWLEGVQLLALYLMAAVVFFALPVRVFGG